MTEHVSLIVGGSSGIGKATAELLARDGRKVLLVARDPKKLAQSKAEIESLGGRAETVPVDLYDRKAVADLCAIIDRETRHIDQLVNAAGYFFPKAFLDHTADDYDKYAELNRAIFQITQAVARNMVRHRGGAIVNIGSM
jgi:short-subunit dehydrogenase